MASIDVPGVRPTGDDQAWKREVGACLQQIAEAIDVINSQLGAR